MTGWEKVAAATVLALIGLMALNLAIWRRLRIATRGGGRSGIDGQDAR